MKSRMIYRAIDDDNEYLLSTLNMAGHSEFEEYDLPDIYIVLRDLLEGKVFKFDTIDEFITCFFRVYFKTSQNRNVQAGLKHAAQNIRKLEDNCIPNNGSHNQLDSFYAFDSFRYNLDVLLSRFKSVSDVQEGVHEKEIIRYLDSFLHLSACTVFQRENSNLSCAQFRDSRYINQLLSFAAERKFLKASELDSEKQIDCYQFSLMDPFVLDTLYKSLCFTYCLYKRKTEIDADLFSLYKNIYLSSVCNSFTRLITLHKEKYLISLNRHNSELMAFPAYQLSSTENIKPIRLFEKIAVYIRKHMYTSAETLEIRICIIGHTETSNAGYESSLMDLASSLLYWYELLPAEENQSRKPGLDLKITNIVNTFDTPESNWEERESFSCEFENHSAQCRIARRDYEMAFAFNVDSIQEIIQENDIIFVLDCPWLSTENFEITQSESINNYCYKIQSQTVMSMESDDLSAFSEDSNLQQLGKQYYRITNSNSSYIGNAVRSIRDNVVTEIQGIVEFENNRKEKDRLKKELYLFISESEGARYSYVESYPWTREERYDGKIFSIISFGNNSINGLQCFQNNDTVFKFNLWGIVKYIDIAYAYCDLKNRIKNALEIDEIDPNAYFELLRNILVILRVDRSLQNIEISVRFGQHIAACISQIGTDCNEQIARAELWTLTMDLIKPLYREAVFSKTRYPGDAAIKNGFMMNLYGSAQDVSGMLFYHEYGKKVRENKLEAGMYSITFENEFHPEIIHGTVDNDYLSTDFFRDRKLYDYLMRNFEIQQEVSYGLERMIDEVIGALRKSAYIIIRARSGETLFLQEIARACEKANRTDTVMYQNIRARLAHNRT